MYSKGGSEEATGVKERWTREQRISIESELLQEELEEREKEEDSNEQEENQENLYKLLGIK